MKKKILVVSIVLCLILSFNISAFAAEDTNYEAVFTAKEKMQDNFDASDIENMFAGLQPGDERTFEVTLRNDHKDSTDWYMENKVIQTLEEQVAAAKNFGGAAYTYKLTYDGNVIYDSTRVGGEDNAGDYNQEGLYGATENLEEWFYLDTLKNGETGKVAFTVGLDGETQANAYQDTLAQVALRFAVELNETPTTPSTPPTPSNNIVKTGDETQLSPMIIMAAVSGLVLLLLAIYGMKIRRDQKKEVQ